MADIAVIGSGSWGTAFSKMLAENGHNVSLWSYSKRESEDLAKYRENKPFLPGIVLPENISFTDDIKKCANGAELIVIATPSHGVRQTAKALSPFVREGQIIVNISKGFDEDTLMRLSEIILNEIPQAKVAAMSGPSHAEEVARNLPTTNVVAHADLEIAQYIQDLFMTPNFRIYTSQDIIGVELGGSLKNIIALCAGISDGLGFGDNTKAALITRGMAEMIRLGRAMGGHLETFAGLTGIGDLIVTCTSMHSRNRRAGILIGQGKTPKQAQEEVKMVVEGVKTTMSAYKLAKKYNVDMPITQKAYEVLFEGKNPREAVSELMERPKKGEVEDLNFTPDIN
ncbi:MAG: NAD(P)H-dependent glycerol-3-phosphate dehydrogenase [Eubacteriales bacterium]|jgi:glycerol-3-phosphate dehydrogenase (NAD(P)+)|nr:NAD(P)H-dependent glycerol-3-phosphate dehydrogenase [Eubacteriales bacterium]